MSRNGQRPASAHHTLQPASHVAGASRYAQIVIKEPSTSEPKKAKRKRITPEQLKELTAVFDKTDTPTHDIREELSQKLGMTNREVQVWFQNRRAKYNRMRAEHQRQMRTNAAIFYGSGILGGMQLPGRLPMAAGTGHGHATRRSTVSSFTGDGGGVNSGGAEPQSGQSPFAPHGTADKVSAAAAARARYLLTVPGGTNIVDGGDRCYHRRPPARTDSPPEAYSCRPAVARQSPPMPEEEPRGAPVRLPSIRAMLAGVEDPRGGRLEVGACTGRTPHRMRAYTSPPPALPDYALPGPGAGRPSTAAPAAGGPQQQQQPPPPIAGAGSPESDCHSVALPLPPSSSSSPPHQRCCPEPQVGDVKVGIEMLAAAAVSVSAIKSTSSLPHLTPLSEFSPSTPAVQRPQDGERGGSSRKVTPVDTGRAGRSWRPW
ncbi:hypothetical protein LPJ61_004693 [Coemansia biformis]|uniref:Homeobox domain-containing protein n=1 Tax=Coemansia biformis TaxID=1286918 RepID=A0A9W8CUF7_9FUNG|nr:hypothetical protein LPJ61_004693 [Coemansia biformis]